MSATDMEILSSPMPTPKIDDYSYTLGFSKGYEAADSSAVCWAFGMCAVLVIIGCFIVLYHHLSRQNDILSRFRIPEKRGENTGNGKVFSLLLPLAFTVCLAGCAGKRGDVVNPAPVPPDVVNAPAPADSANKGTGKFVPHDAAYREDGAGQSLDVYLPADPASGPRKGEPKELAKLLELTGTATSKEQTPEARPPRTRYGRRRGWSRSRLPCPGVTASL